jgi:hypothetical protein
MKCRNMQLCINREASHRRYAGQLRRLLSGDSMGTSQPYSFLDRLGDGFSLFYKLNAEAFCSPFLMQSRLPYTIVNPCGLTDKVVDLGTQVGNCDSFPHPRPVPIIARARALRADVGHERSRGVLAARGALVGQGAPVPACAWRALAAPHLKCMYGRSACAEDHAEASTACRRKGA